MEQEEKNQNSEIAEELDYQEYKGNRFLIYQGILKDVELGCETVLIPENVREIRRQAFLNVRLQNKMETLVLSAAVKKIDKLTFAGMTSLQTVEFPADALIKILEPGVFRNCTNLTRILLPASLRKIESRAFENCIHLDTVVLAAKYIMVKEDAFLNCPVMKNKQIAEAMLYDHQRRKEEEDRRREAKYELFRGLGKKKVQEQEKRQRRTQEQKPKEHQREREQEKTINANVAEEENLIPESDTRKEINANTEFCIRDGILERCEIGCTHIVIPEGVSIIGAEAFSGSLQKELLECLEIPKGVEAIDDRAFYGLTNLKEIYIPPTVSYIGRKAFEGTVWLGEQRKQNSCVIVNGILISAYYDCMVLEAQLPSEIWRIAPYAFHLSEVYRVKIPDTVKEIDAYAFYNAGVTEIELPNQNDLILHIPVIFGCSRLKEILVPENISHLEADIVQNCPSLQRVCLKGSKTSVSRRAFPENVRIWVL